MTTNPCYPGQLANDPGFALLTNDPWYDHHPALQANRAGYESPPPRKRDSWFDPDSIVLVDSNSTRKLTDEELRERLGFVRCSDPQCSQETEDIDTESALVMASALTIPAAAEAVTMTNSLAQTSSVMSASLPQAVLSIHIPLQT